VRVSGATGDQTADLVTRWRQAEERLYPIVIVEPDRFAQIVSVVRAASDQLASETCVDNLVEARRRGRAVVSQAAEAVGIPLAQVGDIELVADAAFALRYRELTAQRHRREVTDTIAAAREQGDRWVVVAESGRQDQPAVQPYQRIEMRVEDGWALRGWIDVDPHTFVPVYGLEELRLDPNTGVVTDAGEPAATRIVATRQQWEAARLEWRDATPP
jgi:hypothetical protein